VRNPDLAAELVDMAERDEYLREELLAEGVLHHGYVPRMRTLHRRNGDRLAAILEQLGRWPSRSIVGDDGAHGAWSIAMHDIANPGLMRASRLLLAEAVRHHDADGADLAHIDDRIHMFETGRQIYGTHFGWGDDGAYGVWPPIEDPDNVEARRRTVGLISLADRLRALADNPSPLPQQLTAEEIRSRRDEEAAFAHSVGWR